VISDMKAHITAKIHDDDLYDFLLKKETWIPRIFNSVDWCTSELALRRLSKNRQMNVIKLCHKYWHTGSHQQIFYGGERPCCLCQESKEEW
jgi:hypothetical protein